MKIMRDITYFDRLNKVELFELCNKVIDYECTSTNEFGTVYTCNFAIINRVVDNKVVHLDVENLRWITYNNGAIIVTGTINGVDYTVRY